MTANQWFLFVALPGLIAALGVLFGETFRMRQKAELDAEAERASASAKTEDAREKETSEEGFWSVQLTEKEAAAFRRFASRWKGGEISKVHGNTSLQTLRDTYGAAFAQGFSADAKLRDILPRLDVTSLGQLVRDYEAGRLEEITRSGSSSRPDRND